MSKRKTKSPRKSSDSQSSCLDTNVCPLCQIPLRFLRITCEVHLIRCEKNSWDKASECTDGINCYSSDFHHYWDFTHFELAKHRSLNGNKIETDKDDSQKKEPDKNVKSASPKKRVKINKINSPKKSMSTNKANKNIMVVPKNVEKKSTKIRTSTKKRKHSLLSETESDSLSETDTESTGMKIPNNKSKKTSIISSKDIANKAKEKINRSVFSDSDDDDFVKVENTTEINSPVQDKSKEFLHFLAITPTKNSQDMFLEEDNISSNKDNCHLNKPTPFTLSNAENKDSVNNIKLSSNDRDLFADDQSIQTNVLLSQELDQEPSCSQLSQELDQEPSCSQLSQEFNQIQTDLNTTLSSQGSLSSFQATLLVPAVDFSNSSESDEDNYEVDSETGEILFTEKIESQIILNTEETINEPKTTSQERNIQNQKNYNENPKISKEGYFYENNKTSVQKQNNDSEQARISPEGYFIEDVQKIEKQITAIEKWKKLLGNKQINEKKKDNNRWKRKDDFNIDKDKEENIDVNRLPFYKTIPGTDFVVDGFKNGVVSNKNNYFLSHFHYDHYIGLNKHFNRTIHCSTITKQLLVTVIKIDEKFIREINVNQTKIINQVEVTALDANHCPGALMFVFKTLDGKCYLHVGDFRADASMENIDILKNTLFDKIYLDTTYCNPKYTFPPQCVVLEQLVRMVESHHKKYPDTLYLCGSYTIGKEKVYMAIIEKMKWKFYVETFKQKILKIIDNEIINKYLVNNTSHAKLHVISMSKLNNIHHLMNYFDSYKSKYSKLVAIKPTGWTYNETSEQVNNINVKQINSNISIYEMSYSEHSSFLELCRFVKFIKYKQIIPTVNVRNSQNQIKTLEISKNKTINKNQLNTLNNYLK